MDSLEKEQLFAAIQMALYSGYSKAAQHVFYDALNMVTENLLEDCIDLAIKHDAFYLIIEFEKLREKHTTAN